MKLSNSEREATRFETPEAADAVADYIENVDRPGSRCWVCPGGVNRWVIRVRDDVDRERGFYCWPFGADDLRAMCKELAYLTEFARATSRTDTEYLVDHMFRCVTFTYDVEPADVAAFVDEYVDNLY